MDGWDFYMLNVDDKIASMFVDLGLSKHAPIQPFPLMAYCSVEMLQPSENGMSSQSEYDALGAIEDSLVPAVTAQRRAIYAGRCTSSGDRDFFFYTNDGPLFEAQVAAAMSKHPTYKFTSGFRDDPEWGSYFRFLYPSPNSLRQISNRHVIDELRDHGDDLSASRPIAHWAYFPSATKRQEFAAIVRNLGFDDIALLESADPGDSFGLRFTRADHLASIDDTTFDLSERAETLGGDYDGWESEVVKAA